MRYDMNSEYKTFKFTKSPYNKGDSVYSKATFTFKPGVTVLVGCNGSGKTTLLNMLIESLRKSPDTIFVSHNNLQDGGHNAVAEAAFCDNWNLAASLVTSSEGEAISQNIGTVAGKIGALVSKNQDNNKDLFVLFDAIDSGLSVDNIVEVKELLFDTILTDCKGKRNVYIICSANEYELCRGEACFDVYNARYISFSNYDEYRDFVLKSRKQKDSRLKEMRD